ncbi:MAG: CdaR family transcriptional regulator [Lachnospiraceae bacterium]|nr:CdaR family transcriptional regulator [Lachnospiraceae bacterium]
MIELELAKKFIEQITQFTDYNINIMNEQGCIIASRDPKRVGTFHEVAYYIMSGKEDMVVTSGENDYPGVRSGINMVIKIDGQRQGVVGITGAPEEVKPVALITKMAIETMLKYEKQQTELLRRRNRKERFASLLIHEEYPDPAVLRSVAQQLNYSEQIIRIPILCTFVEPVAELFLKIIKEDVQHNKEDISFLLDDTRVLLFLTMPGEEEKLFEEYRQRVEECLQEGIAWVEQQGKRCRCFVGSFQNSFTQYYYGYQHCKWLEQRAALLDTIIFFQDFSGDYLRSVIPVNELQRMFHAYENILDDEFKQIYIEIVGILMQCNWNLAEGARGLFMHKNTLLYRYNKIKKRLNVNPIELSADRYFMEYFYEYLKRKL